MKGKFIRSRVTVRKHAKEWTPVRKGNLKVQISLASSDGERHVLIYNEDRSFEYQAPFSKLEIKGLDNVPKRFYEAEVTHQVHDSIEIIFGKRLPDQGW